MDLLQRLIVALLLCPLLSIAAVTASGPGITYSGNTATVAYGNDFHDLMGRSVKNDNMGGGVKVSDSVKVNTSRGPITATATRAVSASAIARGAAVAGRALPYVGAAITVGQAAYEIYDLLDDNRIRPDGNGNLMHDPGVPTAEFEGMCWSYAGNCYLSPSEAGAAFVAYSNANPPTPDTSFTLGGCSIDAPGVAHCDYTATAPNYSANLGMSIPGQLKKQRNCPPPPASTGQIAKDGKCPTGEYTVPLADDEVTDIVEKDVKGKPDRVPLVVDLLARGIGLDSQPTVVSGPASATGTPPAPVVVNTPAGPETTTESPTVKLRYRSPDISWEPEVITTRRPGPNPGDPDEVTDEKTGDDPSADPGVSQAPDPCLANPKRAGCSELGDVEDPPWAPVEKPIELVAESPWGSDDASCPPPRILNIAGQQIPMEWTLWCQLFAGIRYAIVAGAWIAAILIFLGGKGGES